MPGATTHEEKVSLDEKKHLSRRLSKNSTSDKSPIKTQGSYDYIDEPRSPDCISRIDLQQLKILYPGVFEDKKLVLMKSNEQIRELQTIIRDRDTKRSDFIFFADRLIRLAIEEGLNQLPFQDCTVTTHTGAEYKGLKFQKGICGVSIVRSGEAMEKGLRECCRSIRIGKVLISRDEETDHPSVVYARFPPDVEQRKVLLMYPLMRTGESVAVSIEVLLEYGVPEESIYVLTLFATPISLNMLFERFPQVHCLTTEIHEESPTQFGKAYFGTE